MKKNVLSIAILGLAIAIVIVNFWKSNNIEESEDYSQEITVSENIPGVDLSEVEEGKPAPDFKLTTLEGRVVKLSDFKGKKVILNFWATWCPPCKAEMPHLENFYNKYHDKGIEILAVNLTNMEKGEENIKSFVKDYGLTFPILLDVDGSVGLKYQAFTIPTSYIIDSKGVITKKIVGPMDENMMTSLTKDID
ncbi:peroxiredoxin family protein [Aeribacillus alveayuensis]|uniref:Peroxiredoxin n=1 Tax=Aeribacillus alveayuensis TaxID=279215 RepID=A0ABT9VMI9_9BACI|nr:peroxiredoxin [Bacillus alveayuensis]